MFASTLCRSNYTTKPVHSSQGPYGWESNVLYFQLPTFRRKWIEKYLESNSSIFLLAGVEPTNILLRI